MLAYFDTSALVPLLVAESTSGECRRAWDAADTVLATRLAYVEAAAALARAERAGTRRQVDAALDLLDELWPEIRVIEIDESLVRTAAGYARRFGLRGYDAVHCAAAALLAGPTTVAVSGDRQMLAAWSELGVLTLDPGRDP